MMQGMLLVDKPKSWTSFDVVNYVRRQVAEAAGIKPRNIKVGHIGTLDPLATGLLVLLVGSKYTRRAESLTKLDKVYQVECRLGETTDSFDAETEKHFVSDHQPTNDEVLSVLNSFIGKSLQTPPIYSAIKVNGKRAYKLARSGKTAGLAPRPIEIYNLELISYNYPLIVFRARVSSGTYIRSLVSDIGVKLNTGAYMSDLRRLTIGDFSLDNATPVDGLDAEKISQCLID